MDVAIDEAGQDGRAGEVDHLCPGGRFESLLDRGDPVIVNTDRHLLPRCGGDTVYQGTGMDDEVGAERGLSGKSEEQVGCERGKGAVQVRYPDTKTAPSIPLSQWSGSFELERIGWVHCWP